MQAWGRPVSRPPKHEPTGRGEQTPSSSGPRGGSATGQRVRCLPHRPAPGRGRPRAAAPGVVPGHEVVGRVVGIGPGRDAVRRRRPGRRRLAAPHVRALPLVPVAARRTCARTRRTPAGTPTAATPSTPSSRRPSPTGCPDGIRRRATLAPLLCAGIIGYRALRRAALPPGGRLGIYGFGSSAHLTAQLALAQGAEVLRADPRRRGARGWRASSARPGPAAPTTRPPVPLDAAIVFAPAGDLVPVALAALDRGGTLALAGIHMTDVPALDYQRHLFLRADADQRHRQHPRRRRGAAAAGATAGGRRARDRVPVRPGRPGTVGPGAGPALRFGRHHRLPRRVELT